MLNCFYVFIRFLDFIIDGILRNTDSYSDNEISLLKLEGYLFNGLQRIRSKDEENERVYFFFFNFVIFFMIYLIQ